MVIVLVSILQSTLCHLLIISRELKGFRLILDMGKRLSLLVTLKMNHRLVISFQFLFTTDPYNSPLTDILVSG